MTVLEQLVYLGGLLNDKTNATTGEGQRFSAAKKLDSLNAAQDRFCAMVVNDALTELGVNKNIGSVTSSGFALSGLGASEKYFRYVNSKNTTDNVFITKIKAGDVGRQDNSLFAATDDSPYCFIDKDFYFLLVTSFPKSVRLDYIKKPQKLVVSGAAAGEVTTSEINDMFHNVIVRLAEAELKTISKEFENGTALLNAAIQEVILINGNYTTLEKENESVRPSL